MKTTLEIIKVNLYAFRATKLFKNKKDKILQKYEKATKAFVDFKCRLNF